MKTTATISKIPTASGSHPHEAGLHTEMAGNAEMASAYLKALSHPGRLMILCYLIEGEKTVTDLERLLGARQSSVSQHLARLRADRLVKTRREGKAIHYSLSDHRTIHMIGLLHGLFCDNSDT